MAAFFAYRIVLASAAIPTLSQKGRVELLK
jgi:hypothetical protein